MQNNKYIYTFAYHTIESELCKLESRYVFSKEEKDRLLFSDIKVEPSSSAFINKRLDVISSSEDYTTLIDDIKKEKICAEGFKVEYLVFDGDKTEYTERLSKLKDIGFSIDGTPDYHNPQKTYTLCLYEGVWYFSTLIKNNFSWQNHKQKPKSYSNSITMSIAKVLVNIASKGNKDKVLLDACCGVGTIMLEACFAGQQIEGCEINLKICKDARENLSHFDYTANVFHSDIKDISKSYEAAIIDLPYNLFSFSTDEEVLHIIESTAKITERMVIVSTSDITNLIHNTGFQIKDYCTIGKKGNRQFTRKIWVCEKKV